MRTLIPEKDLIKVYIAGPMRGIKKFNRREFNKADKLLTSTGIYETFNPAKVDEESGMTDEDLISKDGLRVVMLRDLQDLIGCHVIYMLHGWEKSEGAKIEHALASMLGMTILYQ